MFQTFLLVGAQRMADVHDAMLDSFSFNKNLSRQLS